jgi:thiol-disulfide isomerase/thioredoxin
MIALVRKPASRNPVSARRSSHSGSRFAALFAYLCLPLLSAWCVGCGARSPGDGPAAAGPLTDAGEVLNKMAAAYQAAKSYEDSGQIRIQFQQGKDKLDKKMDFSAAFERPNRLRMHAYRAIVVCDGQRLRATVGDLPNQVLDREAPKDLTVPAVFSDPVLNVELTQGVVGAPLQLGLLLDKDALDSVLKDAKPPTLIEAQQVDDRPCYGVEIEQESGTLTFWIDQKSFVLRRIDFPAGPLRERFEQSGAKVTGLTLSTEFKGAKLGPKIDDVAFEFELPSDAKLVERFNVLPEPSPLLGQNIKDFAFESLRRKPVDRASLSGKVVVIDFWATWCGWCFKGLPNLQQVYEKYKDNEQVVFLAVSTDDPQVSNDQLTESFAAARLKLPIYRDLDRYSDGVFQVSNLPTTVILGADGKVQAYETGYQANMAAELPVKLERLLAGKNLYEETIRAYEDGFKLEPAEAPPAEAEVAERTEPEKLKLTKLWTCGDAEQPGNVLVVPAAEGDDRIFVLDNLRTVLELASDGSVKDRHELDLPEELDGGVVSFLRTAVDSEGKRYFAGSANGVQQLHLFDEQWKTLLSFPKAGRHAGISDVQLGDLDGDGQPEINVGYWGEVGVQNVSFSGERSWTNRDVDNIFRLAVTSADANGRRQLLASSVHGNIASFDSAGKSGKPTTLEGRFLRLIYAADLDGDGQSERCAVAQSIAEGKERDVLVGMDAAGGELWSYPLPAGAPAVPAAANEMVMSGKLIADGPGQWIVGGADGSIHILGADGQIVDHFNSGVALSGIGVARFDDGHVLLTSSERGVEAWRFEP